MINPTIQATLLNPKGGTIINMGYGADLPIISAMWSLQQGEDASQCTVEIPGDRLEVVDKLLSLKPYQPQPPTPATQSAGTGTLASEGNRKEVLAQERAIVAECKRQGVTNPKQIAYILATAQHETGGYVWLTEIASGDAYEGDRELGNTQPGDGRRFKGRGYVQLTGRANYAKYSNILGKDLIANPGTVASNQDVARFVLVHGMKTGTFTGAKLADYTSRTGDVNYVQARRIVNGTDRAESIATRARTYEQRVTSGDLSVSDGTVMMVTQPQPIPSPSPLAPPDTEAGGKLIIRMGEWGGLTYEWVYLLSNVELTVDQSGAQLTLSGISPLWTINQYRQSSTKGNLSLKQLAKLVANERKLTLQFEGEGTQYQHIEQSGLTNYQLLLREASRAGYVIYHEGTKMIMHPIKPTGSPYEISITDVLSLTTQSKPGGQTPGGRSGLRGSWEQQPTVKQDSRTAQLLPTSVPPKPTNQAVQGQPIPKQRAAVTTGTVKTGGKVISELSAQAEVARVMDNPTQLDLVANSKYWSIAPSNTVRIPNAVVWSASVGESTYWVYGVHFSINAQQGLQQSLDLYKPGVEVAVSQAMSGQSGIGTVQPTMLSSGWVHPYPGSQQTGRYGEQRSTHRHSGIDFAGGNGVIVSAASGVVSDIQSGCRVGDFRCGGGYGNYVDIISNVNGTQYLHRYAHLAAINNLRVGSQVQAGKQIGTEGNTGHSYGNHLHFEIRQPNQRFGFGGTIDPASVGIR
jgi:murein DD-endopeptidase MepM/ murein hydrolase activator NlpD